MLKEILESNKIDPELLNAIKSYTNIGGYLRSEDYVWTSKKRDILIKNIKKRKPVIGYRAINVSEKQWFEMFENGYTEIGNINFESGLTSFTLDENMTRRFRGGNEVTFVIEVELNKYLPILENSLFPEEAEVLAFNVKWEVTGIREEKYGRWIVGKQVK